MYEFVATHLAPAPLDAVWEVWSDLTGQPAWDPRTRQVLLDGPFVAGTTGHVRRTGSPSGPFRIARVDPPHGWDTSTTLPGGELRWSHHLEPADGGTLLTLTYRATGPLELLHRVLWGPATRRSLSATWSGLDARLAAH